MNGIVGRKHTEREPRVPSSTSTACHKRTGEEGFSSERYLAYHERNADMVLYRFVVKHFSIVPNYGTSYLPIENNFL